MKSLSYNKETGLWECTIFPYLASICNNRGILLPRQDFNDLCKEFKFSNEELMAIFKTTPKTLAQWRRKDYLPNSPSIALLLIKNILNKDNY